MEQRRGEFGESFFPDLAERIRNPTVSPLFKLYANEGLDTLRSNFATTGSPSSGPAQVAGGRFLEGLAAQQLDKGDQMLMAAANFRGQLPVTQEPAFLNSELGTRTARSNYATNAINSYNQQQAQDSSGFGGLFGNLLGAGLGAFGLPSLGGIFGGGGSSGPWSSTSGLGGGIDPYR
jgi:hypothetical protein